MVGSTVDSIYVFFQFYSYSKDLSAFSRKKITPSETYYDFVVGTFRVLQDCSLCSRMHTHVFFCCVRFQFCRLLRSRCDSDSRTHGTREVLISVSESFLSFPCRVTLDSRFDYNSNAVRSREVCASYISCIRF